MTRAALRGKPVSPGIAIGKAYRCLPRSNQIAPACCAPEEAEAELARFRSALDTAFAEIDALAADSGAELRDRALIFLAHRELLSDEELHAMIEAGILEEHRRAEYAVDTAFAELICILGAVDDPLIAARTADLEDLRNRLLRILSGDRGPDLSSLPENTILLAHDLLPSDTATLDRAHVLGILTEAGSDTSHSAIIARSLGIPAVLGAEGILSLTGDGELLILDGETGGILLSPSPETLREYEQQRSLFQRRQRLTEQYLDAEARTRDGHRICIGLNIGREAPEDLCRCTDDIGLFRTEFLYMENDHLPTEQEQFAAYRRILAQAGGHPVTLRTLDIGGDKQLSFLPLPREENPFLGRRALRLCFAHEELFITQLRAAYRASAYGNLSIMFPMVGSLDDLIRAKNTALSVRQALEAEGVPLGDVPLGLMIEVPAMGMIPDLAAEYSDFASIGTNDLCQYLCAADRMNPAVADSCQSCSPAMLRMLSGIIRAYDAAKKPVSVCGELAGQPGPALLLVGLGLRKLSMNGASVAAVKQALAAHSLAELQEAAKAALDCRTEQEVFSVIDGLLAGRYRKESL